MTDNLIALSFERLDVYQKSARFLAHSLRIASIMPKGFASLADQLKRAAMSIPLNIGEGCGRTGKLDQAKHFAIARGSALECAAILNVCFIMEIIDQDNVNEGKKLLVDIVSMLTKLIRQRQSW